MKAEKVLPVVRKFGAEIAGKPARNLSTSALRRQPDSGQLMLRGACASAAHLMQQQQRVGAGPSFEASAISEMQNANPWKLNVLSNRRHAHKVPDLRSSNYIASDQRVVMLDEFLSFHLCIWKCEPECIVEGLHTVQFRLNFRIPMQDDVLGIEVEILLSSAGISKTLDRVGQVFSIGHGPGLSNSRNILAVLPA